MLLPSVDKAAKIKRADNIHAGLTWFVVIALFIVGVLGAFILPEEYKNSGVFNGSFHAVGRCVVQITAVGLLMFCVRMGNKIKDALASGGGGKVAPAPDGKPAEKKKEPTDADKIAVMVAFTTKVMCVVILYLFYDIAISVGKYRHITPPMCEPKNVFIRLPSFVQLMAAVAVTYVFPVKKPEMKTGKTGMMGTTVINSTSSQS